MNVWKIAFLLIIAMGISQSSIQPANSQEFKLIPKQRPAVAANGPQGTTVGTGWSSKENPEEATKEAIEMAIGSKRERAPDFAIIFATSGSDLKAILSSSQKLFNNKTKIYGGTSDSRAVMTDRGYARATERAYESAMTEGKRSLAIMAVTSKDIRFGVGSANLQNYPSIKEGAKQALLKAIRNAGKSRNEPPKAILLTSGRGMEEEVIEGIEAVTGKKVPIIGGTSGGPTFSVFGENDVYEKGLSLAVIYTKFSVGTFFEGGFDVKDRHSGIVTKVDGQAIVEIDNRPALDVYDEWLGGEIRKLYDQKEESDTIRTLLTLHPLYRRYQAPDGTIYNLFSHPWPKDKTLKGRSIATSTKIGPGERLYVSHGTWETLMNRISNLPKKAKESAGIDVTVKPVLGIGYLCAGVLGVIPESERAKLPYLINYTNNDSPFIATITWGEQGYFPGIGNKHGNLLTSFLVICDKKK